MFMGCASQPEQQEPIQTEEVSSMETAQEETEQLVDDMQDENPEFQKTIEKEQLKKSYQNVLFQNYLKTASNHAEKGQYQEAYQFVLEALKLEPNHREALDLKRAYGSKLGFEPDEVAERLNEAEQLVNVRIDQTRLEIENQMAEGKHCLKEKDYERAISLFKQAKEKIRWMPYHVVDLEGKAKQIDFLIQKAEEENERYKEEVSLQRRREAAEEKKRDEIARLNTLREQVQNLLRQANIAFGKEKYELARSFCEQVQILEPDNTEVYNLLNLIKHARHAKSMDNSRNVYLEEWKKTFEMVEAAMIPNHNIVQFPSYENWKKISKRGSKTVGEEEAEESIENRIIRERLESETMDMDFTEAPLPEVVDYLRNTTGINIIIDPEVFKEYPEEDSLKVDLTLNKAKISSILNLILSLKDLAYRITNGVLVISTKKRIVDKPVLRLYNVRDLTGKLKDFPGLNMSLSTDERDETTISGALLGQEETGREAAITEEQLTELIKSNIAKASWDLGDCSIETRHGTLIVRQVEDVHQQIDSLLNDLRKATGLLVTIEARFLTVSDDFLEDIGVDWRNLGAVSMNAGERQFKAGPEDDHVRTDTTYAPLDDAIFSAEAGEDSIGTGKSSGIFYRKQNFDTRHRLENIFDETLGSKGVTNIGGLNMQMAYVDEIELNMVLQAVRKKYRSNQLNAPRLTVFNTQRANVTIISQYAYIQDFDVEVATAAVIADPIVGTVQDGVILDVRPIISSDRKYITLELQPTVAELIELVPFKTHLASSGAGGGGTVTIQAPNLRLSRIKTNVTIPDGGTILLGGLIKATKQDSMSGVPVLSDLPIISFFTSRKGKFTHRESLLILVTAKITSMEEQEPNEGRE
ncbi:MAG: hypothetical protein KBC30_06365 [Planctomycetes bacterium]|nr:hypothetical protein [Planctomycetota bacterium]HPY74187.1 hypothetical protein [Planctomycetota bacterium]HQA99801.1 hypothetical protein [Planctomycetota bacterium]